MLAGMGGALLASSDLAYVNDVIEYSLEYFPRYLKCDSTRFVSYHFHE